MSSDGDHEHDHSEMDFICTPYGHITFMVQVETPFGLNRICTSNLLEAAYTFRETVDAFTKIKRNTPVQLVLVIVPPLDSISEEDREAALKGNQVPAYGHTLETWIGEPDVNSVEEFLKNHPTNEQ
jgi:hypothetical protein